MYDKSEEGRDPTVADPRIQAQALKSLARRRLIRGGLSAAPVMLTFVSRPSPAVTNADGCLSASASISLQAGAHSNGAGILRGASGCTGIGPAAWRTTGFPSGITVSTLFADYFPGYAAGKTFGQILTTPDLVVGDAQSQLRRNLVAALLNLQSGRLSTSVVTLATLTTIWTALKSRGPGVWTVRGTMTWNLAQTNDWFNTLFQAADK